MTYKIGFLGAGRMASAMIKRLLSQGFDIKVWNRSQGKLAPLVALGAHACKSPADAANDVDAVISFMASDDAARDVWLDNKSGALSTMRPGTIAIECSTLSHGFVKDLAQTIIDAGCLYLDAPVTAVPEQVEAGKTTFLIGADDAALEKARPILEAAGQKIIKFGTPGAGTVYKLMNNLIGAVHIAAAAEMLALAQKAGLDTELAARTLASGPLASSPAVKTLSGMVSGNHNEGIHFTTGLRSKDARYALQLAEEYGLSLPVGKAAHGMFETATKQGAGDLAQSAVIETLKG